MSESLAAIALFPLTLVRRPKWLTDVPEDGLRSFVMDSRHEARRRRALLSGHFSGLVGTSRFLSHVPVAIGPSRCLILSPI